MTVRVLVRVWLPDRPGALGQVASRIGAVRGDISGVDVLEQDGGIAIDEFAVTLAAPDLISMLVREIEQVDGASVEEVRTVAHFPDPRLDGLESAARLCEAAGPDDLLHTLSRQVLDEFLADWSAIVAGDRVIAGAGRVPESPALLSALAAGTTASPMVATGEAGPADLAVAALPDHAATLLVGRDGHPFRRRERAQLLALARVADRAWTLVDTHAATLP